MGMAITLLKVRKEKFSVGLVREKERSFIKKKYIFQKMR